MAEKFYTNDVGCKLYDNFRCNLYPDKYCIGDQCVVWNLYARNNAIQETVNCANEKTKLEADKVLLLLRLICHSENSKLYVKDNYSIIELTDCSQTYRFPFVNRTEEIIDKFFDLQIKYELPEQN